MSTVLVIEDDAMIRSNVTDLLEAEGFSVVVAENGEAGVEQAVRHLPDVIVCDVGMPGMDGFSVFEMLSAKPATAVIPFVFLTARAERESVRRGMSLGAADYLTKPFTRAELLDSIQARLKRRLLPASDAPSHGPPERSSESERFVVVDSSMVSIAAQLARFAPSPISVLILGETGVGKEIVAEEIHRLSGRSGRFVPLNCAALTESLLESELFGHERGSFTGALQTKEGLFEAAEGGTLFLDEVGELPATTQAKLLRVLEERKVMRVGGRVARAVDVRFVSATNRDVESDIEAGSFRRDLYFRLNGISLTIPPLRERRADIEPLCLRFAETVCERMGRSSVPRVSPDSMAMLETYAWPGNIRELRNVVERAVLLCDGDVLRPEHLPTVWGPSGNSSRPSRVASDAEDSDPRARLVQEMERVDRERIAEAVARCGGNQTQAAELLGISRRTLVTRLGHYGLPRPRGTRPPRS